MSNSQLTDRGWLDPYSLAVGDFLRLVDDRFPEDLSWTPSRDQILILEHELSGSYHESLELVQVMLCDLVQLLEKLPVPRRDMNLLRSQLLRCEKLSELYSGQILSVQLALQEAYLDATMDERAELLRLADLRDLAFELGGKSSIVKEFQEALLKLVDSRQRRGWPSWRRLELFCKELALPGTEVIALESSGSARD